MTFVRTRPSPAGRSSGCSPRSRSGPCSRCSAIARARLYRGRLLRSHIVFAAERHGSLAGQIWMHHLRTSMIAVATVVLSGTAVAVQPNAVPPSSISREAEADVAERWALYGVFVPIGVATAIGIVTNPSENDVPTPVLGAIGGLWALGGLWGVSAGYYRAGRPLAGTLLGLGKTALLGSCLLVHRAIADSASTDSMEQGTAAPPLLHRSRHRRHCRLGRFRLSAPRPLDSRASVRRGGASSNHRNRLPRCRGTQRPVLRVQPSQSDGHVGRCAPSCGRR